jgi:hypothetical protein
MVFDILSTIQGEDLIFGLPFTDDPGQEWDI